MVHRKWKWQTAYLLPGIHQNNPSVLQYYKAKVVKNHQHNSSGLRVSPISNYGVNCQIMSTLNVINHWFVLKFLQIRAQKTLV